MTDPIQEFSEVVAKRWWDAYGSAWGKYIPPLHEDRLATLIAFELRAGGWRKIGEPVKGEPLPYDLEVYFAERHKGANPDVEVGFISNT